jgi:hypothetical protein
VAPPKIFESYSGYLAETRRQLRPTLDLPPQEWAAPADARQFKDVGPLRFSADDVPEPADDDVSAVCAQYPLIRPAPYPFFRMLSIPADCCATQFPDVFYTHSLLSRRFGLDTGFSFFPFSAGGAASLPHGGPPVLFWKGQREPRVAPVRVESEDIDVLPLFLSYYYRGWLDHLHSWSTDSTPALSLVARTSRGFAEDGEVEVELQTFGGITTELQGFDVSIRATEGVASFELTLEDPDGMRHHVVFGTELGDRPGWDLSGRTRAELVHAYLRLADEHNRPSLRSLGRPGADGTVLRGASLWATGTKGARIEVTAVRAFDLTREMIEGEMARLRELNVLPSCTSYHGGYSDWAALLPPPRPFTLKGRQVVRSALGARRGTPAYHADLLHRFGVDFLLHFDPAGEDRFGPIRTEDGTKWYGFRRDLTGPEDERFPAASSHDERAENLGRLVAGFLASVPDFGDACSLYTHFDYYNGAAFVAPCPATLQMSAVKKLHPHAEAALRLLSDAFYDLDGLRKASQRVWVGPVGVQMRFLQVRGALADHARLDGNTVRVTPWTDPVTERFCPDPDFLSQDLHGQTFYVPDASTARVFVKDVEIKSLTRNPPDFTGRESVTVVDVTTPTVVFDEVDLAEQNGRTVPDGASCFFRRVPYAGEYALEVRAEQSGHCGVRWEPFRLSSHESEFLRFAYRKTNPATKAEFSWVLTDGTAAVVTEGELGGRQGWQVARRDDCDYHEVVVSFADMQGPTLGDKLLPRGEVSGVTFGLDDASPGDSVFFDRVEFLAARGVRPHCGHGLVVGGRLYPNLDGETVTLTVGRQTRRATTTRGGWFLFTGVPAESVVEIAYERDGVKYFPLQGRLTQVVRNDVELHIHATDVRSPFVPRPTGYVGLPVTDAVAAKETGASPEHRQQFEAVYEPHAYRFCAGLPSKKRCYMVEEHVNNYGFADRDRTVENPDGAVRIFLQGDCWVEGLQTPVSQHINVLLESLLRRRYGVPVEVLVAAKASSSPATYSLTFEKYGARFRPDLVLIFLGPLNMAHLEPTLLRNLTGWDKEHAPSRMYDFDEQGKLVGYPPDPAQVAAFQVKPNPAPLIGSAPLAVSFSAVELDHALVARSFDLLRAVLKEQYVERLRSQPTRVGLVYGHDTMTPAYGTRFEHAAVADEVWRNAVSATCAELKILGLDLSRHLARGRLAPAMTWEDDDHLTASANYRIAAALAEEIGRQPFFRDLVEKRRKGAEIAEQQESGGR